MLPRDGSAGGRMDRSSADSFVNAWAVCVSSIDTKPCSFLFLDMKFHLLELLSLSGLVSPLAAAPPRIESRFVLPNDPNPDATEATVSLAPPKEGIRKRFFFSLLSFLVSSFAELGLSLTLKLSEEREPNLPEGEVISPVSLADERREMEGRNLSDEADIPDIERGRPVKGVEVPERDGAGPSPHIDLTCSRTACA